MDDGTKKILFDTPETSSTFLVPCSAGCGTLVDLNHTFEHYGELCARLQIRNQSSDCSPTHAIPAERMFRINVEMQFKKQILSHQEKRRVASNGRGSPLGITSSANQSGDNTPGPGKGKRRSRRSRPLPTKAAPSKRSRPSTAVPELNLCHTVSQKEENNSVNLEIPDVRPINTRKRKNEPISHFTNGLDPPNEKGPSETSTVSSPERKIEIATLEECKPSTSPPESSQPIPVLLNKAPIVLSESQLLYQRQQLCLRALRAIECLQYERRLYAAAMYKQQLLTSRDNVVSRSASHTETEACQTKERQSTSTSQCDKPFESKPPSSAPPLLTASRSISDNNTLSRVISVQTSKQNDYLSGKRFANIATVVSGVNTVASKHNSMIASQLPLPPNSQSFSSSAFISSNLQNRNRFISPHFGIDSDQKQSGTMDGLEIAREQQHFFNKTLGYSLSSLEPFYEMETLPTSESAKIQDPSANTNILTALLTKSESICHVQSIHPTFSTSIPQRSLINYHSSSGIEPSLLLSSTTPSACIRSGVAPSSRPAFTAVYPQALSSTVASPLCPVVPQFLARRGFVGRVGQRLPSMPQQSIQQQSSPQSYSLATSTVRIIPSISSFPSGMSIVSNSNNVSKSLVPMAVIRNSKMDDLTNSHSRPNPTPTRFSGVVHSSATSAQLHVQGPI